MSADKEVVHPLTKQVYRLTPEGLVEVYDPATGLRGLFDERGQWQSGELRYADLQIAGWVGRLARRNPLPEEP
ncbi:transposase [Actinomadura rudentiformis]|uniref:Transposase n=1 Tax=Actinomadura rudentiformis TaxID=359158 RepID=A0A6H9YLN8_9ACTN|nr:transposase [Actinomadura rudentiformis]KAB2340380.1 transposase [Actinomadura rudentiformis]